MKKNRPLHVFLVNPACLDSRVTDEDARSIPMGLYTIGAVLRERSLPVTLVNLAEALHPLDHLDGMLEAHQPDVVGFSLLNANRMNAMAGAMRVKEKLPGTPVVFGGPGATFLTDHLFAACPALDYIVQGEGEISFSSLVDYLAGATNDPPRHIPGLVFREKGALVDTGPPGAIEDLDTLPHPAAFFSYAHISLSRGCPGRCRFCGSPSFWGGSRVRFHSPQWFVDEMALLVQRGITHFFISDDTFTLDRKRVKAVCQLIVERGLSCTWVAISRVDVIDESLLYLLRRAGCIQISFGVESGSEIIRKTLGKPFDARQIARAFEMTRYYGILPRAYLIYGSPGETTRTIDQTIDLMHQIQPLALVAYMLVLFPGTRLYTDLKDRGQVSDEIWYQQIEDVPWFQLDPDLDAETVIRFGKKIRNTFFSHVAQYARTVCLVDIPELYPLHADFFSRLAMTFSHGDYSQHPRVKAPLETARILYERSLSYAPDARAFLGLGMLHQKKKEFDKAVSLMEEALAAFPGHRGLNTCLAVSLMNLGRFSRALSILLKFNHHPDMQPYIDACRARGA